MYELEHSNKYSVDKKQLIVGDICFPQLNVSYSK